MAYKKNYHEIEISGQELTNILKDFAIDNHNVALDDAPSPRSHNQMEVEFRDLQEQIVKIKWVKIRWNI
jgi:hypothetical protein